MGRRRLQTILATTLLAAGLSTVPAFAQDLGGLTSTVEETVTSTTDEVTGTVEDTVGGLVGSDDGGTADDGTDGTTTEDTSTSTDGTSTGDTTSDDGGETEGDSGPLSIDLEVDLAPEDEDGSPQLEVDGGVTVGEQTIDVGGATDPIEDAVDPDPDPEPESETGTDDTSSGSTEQDETDASETTRDHSGPGGFLEGGGVTAAGGDARPADQPGPDGSAPAGSGSTFAESFAAFGALNGRFGLQRFDGGTMAMRGQQAVAPPEVAAPLTDDEPLEPLVAEEPQTADRDREVAELAMQPSGPLGGDSSPLPIALKGFAAALLAATAFRAKRVLDQA